jgi:membrane-associated protease RseP (regulator of RpoE activity)
MNRFFPSLLAGWLGGAALAILLTVTTLAAADEPPEGAGPDIGQRQLEVFQPVSPSDYWLGIGFRPLGEALRAQLALPEGQGLLVEQVMPETPAARSELKRHDIVLKADGKPLGGIQDLIDAVDAAKDGELPLEIIRGGKPMTIKVKPEKRPEGPVFGHPGPVPGHPERHGILELLEQLGPGLGETPFRLRLFNPGVILPPGSPAHAPLPEGLSVTISKQGGQPAEIEVRRGEENWSVDENDLDELPPDVSVHVGRMLGGVPLGTDGQVRIESRGRPARTFQWPQVFGADGEGRLEKRLEEMNGRIERLQEMMEGLREKRPRKKGSDEKTPEEKTPKAEPEQA